MKISWLKREDNKRLILLFGGWSTGEAFYSGIDVPGWDVLLGSAKLTVTGGRSAVIENHRGVLEYTAERIVVAVPRGKVCLDGTGLRLKAMNKNELLVGGRIRNIEWG